MHSPLLSIYFYHAKSSFLAVQELPSAGFRAFCSFLIFLYIFFLYTDIPLSFNIFHTIHASNSESSSQPRLPHRILLFSFTIGPSPFIPFVEITSTHTALLDQPTLVTPVLLHISFLTVHTHYSTHIPQSPHLHFI